MRTELKLKLIKEANGTSFANAVEDVFDQITKKGAQ